MTKIINLFAGPGSGKSTTAAGLFHKMKKKGLSVELVTEYAKEKVWENSKEILSDQLYLLAKQNRRLERLRGKVDWVITDSPLLLGAYFGEKYGEHPEIVVPATHGIFKTYDNLNFFILRTKPFDPRGRVGNEEGARRADAGIKEILASYSVTEVVDDEGILDNIFWEVMK
jgi:hypothetical protein